jgi:hypothetical protein
VDVLLLDLDIPPPFVLGRGGLKGGLLRLRGFAVSEGAMSEGT